MKRKIFTVLAAYLLLVSLPAQGSAGFVRLNGEETKSMLEKFTAEAAAADAEPVLMGEDTGTAETFTGLEPLPEVHYTPFDPQNEKNLSKKVMEHSYGVAKDGKVHSISAESQRYFEAKGFNAFTYDDETEEKVLYLTFDCGYENGNTAKILDVLQEKQVPAAFFCTLYQVQSQPELTARMIREGHIVGNHSCSHPNFSELSAQQIAEELEGFDNYMRTRFGYCASFFRYPEGAYSDYALSEVTAQGFTVAFWSLAYADWDENNQKGADYALETVTSRLHPGAVILLHSVSSDNAAAMGSIIDAARAQGYEFRSLTDLPR